MLHIWKHMPSNATGHLSNSCILLSASVADRCSIFAGSGLIAFALTVALVQQSVRGAIEANVKTGGTLFEIDHVRILAQPLPVTDD